MLDRSIDILAGMAGCLLCTLAGLICIDVGARYLQLFPMPWTLDIAEYHLYAMTFLAAPWVLRNGGHISVDLLLQHLSRRNTQRLSWFASLLGVLVCLILFYYGLKVLWASYNANTLIYKALIMPEWPLFIVPPITFLLMSLVFLRWLFAPPIAHQGQLDGF